MPATGTTSYRLDSLGFEPSWGEIFHTHPDHPWGPPSLYTAGTGSFSQA